MLRTELSRRPSSSRAVKSASRAALTRWAIWSSAQSSGLRLPVVGVGSPVEDLRDAMRVDGELEGVGPLGAERALVDRTVGIALDVDELAALGVDELAAADGAVGTDALGDGGAAQPRGLRRRLRAERLPGRFGVRTRGG